MECIIITVVYREEIGVPDGCLNIRSHELKAKDLRLEPWKSSSWNGDPMRSLMRTIVRMPSINGYSLECNLVQVLFSSKVFLCYLEWYFLLLLLNIYLSKFLRLQLNILYLHSSIVTKCVHLKNNSDWFLFLLLIESSPRDTVKISTLG